MCGRARSLSPNMGKRIDMRRHYHRVSENDTRVRLKLPNDWFRISISRVRSRTQYRYRVSKNLVKSRAVVVCCGVHMPCRVTLHVQRVSEKWQSEISGREGFRRPRVVFKSTRSVHGWDLLSNSASQVHWSRRRVGTSQYHYTLWEFSRNDVISWL